MKINSLYRFSGIVLMICTAAFAGCSGEESPEVSQDEIELLPEMPQAAVDVKPVSHRSISSPRVSLQRGDQYYFVKSIEQKLGIEPGNPIGRVWERVEFLLSLTVREETSEGYLLDVVFHNVRYQSERGEHHVLYDSRSQTPVPAEALPYRGMIDRGFTLHLDRRNRLVDVVGFDQFLAECFAEYPVELRRELMLSMGGVSTDPRERIDSALVFLDESFALLPFGEARDAFSVGTHWSRDYYSRAYPVPVRQQIDATLQNISGEGQLSEVVIKGELKPLTSPPETASIKQGRSRVTGGTITGSCSVSLTTGLPKTCRIQREIRMELVPPGQEPIPLRKTIVTALEEASTPSGANAE